MAGFIRKIKKKAMITQIEKDALILALNTVIDEYGKNYSVGLKYGICKDEQELFIAASYKKMLNFYSVFPEEANAIYSFEGGTVTIDDGTPVTLTGTIEEVAFEIVKQNLGVTASLIIDDVLYIYIGESLGTTVTGDVDDDNCAACILDENNCCTTEEMYKIYDKYICTSNCPTETNIP